MSPSDVQARRIETREVLANAYLGPNKNRGRMLTHAVIVDRYKGDIEVLCRRVSILSIADGGSLDEAGRFAAPTCEYCQRALKKRDAHV